jgi:hypothetical protein
MPRTWVSEFVNQIRTWLGHCCSKNNVLTQTNVTLCCVVLFWSDLATLALLDELYSRRIVHSGKDAQSTENRRSRDSTVGKSSIPGKVTNFSLHHHVRFGSTAHPVPYTMGTGGCFPEVRRLGRENYHHLRLMTRLRMRGAIPLLPSYVFMVWWLTEHRDNFTVTCN